MVRIGKFFKRKGDHKDGDVGKDGGDGSVMSKGSTKGTQIEETGLSEQDFPVDAADNEPIDDATHKSSFAEKPEQREEAPETYPFDLGLSASESNVAFPSQEQTGDGATDDEDAVTMDTQFNTYLSDKSSFTTAMEEEVTAKYFHKILAVNSLGDTDDGATDDEDAATTDDIDTQFNSDLSDKSSFTTGMEEEVTAKYFHKYVVVDSLGNGSNDLVIREEYCIPKPNAKDHVVVKVEACTISPRDAINCKGHGLTKNMLPYIPGYDIVGTIQLVGDDAKKGGSMRKGDRVAGVSTFGGGNSRFISIPAKRLTKISHNVKSTHAVCLLHDYMAAIKTLRLARKNGSPFTGLNILITDGFSPVGQAIIALASLEGANLYCCADESKHTYLASLGAKCFDKNPEIWLPGVANTFDIVIENTRINDHSSSWQALNKKGTLVCLGPSYNIDSDIQSPPSACGVLELTEMHQKWSELKVKYIMSQTYFLNTATAFEDDTEQYRQDLRYLLFLCARGGIIPKVAKLVALDDVPNAQRLIHMGKANGTVVCAPWLQK